MSQIFSLEGKTFLITGGTRGIGRAVSLQFARAGATVVSNYVRGQKAADLLLAQADREHLRLTLCRADLTIEKGLETIEQHMAGLIGGLHGLVHCAATGVHKPYAELSVRHYDWTFALNVRSFFDLVKRLLPRFSADASIVTMSSQGSLRVVPAYSIVGASKGALEALARHMAVELAPRGIRVNIIAPGAVATEAWASMPDAQARQARSAWQVGYDRRGCASRSFPLFRCGSNHHRPDIDGGRRSRLTRIGTVIDPEPSDSLSRARRVD